MHPFGVADTPKVRAPAHKADAGQGSGQGLHDLVIAGATKQRMRVRDDSDAAYRLAG
jgi:hypothetical protein